MLMWYLIIVIQYQYVEFNWLNFNKSLLIILNRGVVFGIQNKFEIKNSFIKQKYVSYFLSFSNEAYSKFHSRIVHTRNK